MLLVTENLFFSWINIEIVTEMHEHQIFYEIEHFMLYVWYVKPCNFLEIISSSMSCTYALTMEEFSIFLVREFY